MNILLEQGPGVPPRRGAPYNDHIAADPHIHADTCMETSLNTRQEETLKYADSCIVAHLSTQQISSSHMASSVCVGGHRGCYVPFKDIPSSQHLDSLFSKAKYSDKSKGNGLLVPEVSYGQNIQGHMGEYEAGFPISHEGHFND